MSLYMGVCLHKKSRMWRATHRKEGQRIHIGHFREMEGVCSSACASCSACAHMAQNGFGTSELHARTHAQTTHVQHAHTRTQMP